MGGGEAGGGTQLRRRHGQAFSSKFGVFFWSCLGFEVFFGIFPHNVVTVTRYPGAEGGARCVVLGPGSRR